MLKRVLLLCVAAALGTPLLAQVELANLREDVRGLSQRVAELSLRVEQLERQNNDLSARAGTADRAYVTLTQLNQSLSDVNRNIQVAVNVSRSETMQQVAQQMEKLAKQTNAAIEALSKNGGAHPAAGAAGPTNFSDDYPKEGVSYIVQKGDSLALIAKKTGAKSADIINANKISDPSRIVAGQTLFIPGGK